MGLFGVSLVPEISAGLFSLPGWFCAEKKKSASVVVIAEQKGIEASEMGKNPVKLKAVIYALSPFQQKVMSGLWKNLPDKINQKISENWLNAYLLLTPLVGTYTYVKWYKEKEKLAHRY